MASANASLPGEYPSRPVPCWDMDTVRLANESMPQLVKNLPANAGDVKDTGSITGLRRFLGAGNSNPFQYSCLKSPMDRRAWWATVHGVPKSQTQLSMHTYRWAFFKLLPLHQAMGWVRMLANPLKADSQFTITLWAPFVFRPRCFGASSLTCWSEELEYLMWGVNPLLLSERFWICGYPPDCGMLCQAWGLWQNCT